MGKSTTVKAEKSGRKSTGAASGSKKGKYIIGAGILVLGLGAMVIAGMPDEKPAKSEQPARAGSASTQAAAVQAAASGDLAAAETQFDFGSISMAAGKVTHRFKVSNSGAQPILIQKIYTSCMCTTAALLKGVRQFGPYGMPGHTPIPAVNQSLAPGERAFIEVVFDPAAHGPAGVGPIERVVTVENSAQPPLQLAFAARVTP